VHRKVEISVGVDQKNSNTPAEEDMARELRSPVERASDKTYEFGRIHELPVGDAGYAVYYTVKGGGGDSSDYVQAAYTVGDTTHVLIKVTTRVATGKDLVAPPEDAMITDLVTVLTAIGS
jgi:hypothetical protein